MTILTRIRTGAKDAKSEAAIIFLHGFGGESRATWGNFPDYLLQEKSLANWDMFSIGYPTRLFFDWMYGWRRLPDLQTLADSLRTRLNSAELAGYQALAVIAHSMGGLVAQRALLDDPKLRQRLSHLFLFGTPSNGLRKASFFKFHSRQTGNMAEGSPFIKALRDDWQRMEQGGGCPFAFAAIAGDLDDFVPVRSSLAPFAREYRHVIAGDHLRIVKPLDQTAQGVRLVADLMLGRRTDASIWDSARAAVARNDYLEIVTGWGGHPDELSEDTLIELALAYTELGETERAIRILEERTGRLTTDAMGVLAGRYKRRWWLERKKDDGDKAMELYSRAYEQSTALSADGKCADLEQAYYHGINLAFLYLAYLRDEERAQHMAQKVLAICSDAPTRFWHSATIGEALLILKETDKAFAAYSSVFPAKPKPKQRELESMFQQAMRIAEVRRDEELAERLATTFGGDEK